MFLADTILTLYTVGFKKMTNIFQKISFLLGLLIGVNCFANPTNLVDVIVSGAGISGIAAGKHLQNQGLSVS